MYIYYFCYDIRGGADIEPFPEKIELAISNCHTILQISPGSQCICDNCPAASEVSANKILLTAGVTTHLQH